MFLIALVDWWLVVQWTSSNELVGANEALFLFHLSLVVTQRDHGKKWSFVCIWFKSYHFLHFVQLKPIFILRLCPYPSEIHPDLVHTLSWYNWIYFLYVFPSSVMARFLIKMNAFSMVLVVVPAAILILNVFLFQEGVCFIQSTLLEFLF